MNTGHSSVIVLLFALGLCPKLGACRDVSIRAMLGYNFYSMQDLKDLQSDVLEELHKIGVSAKVFNNFPPYWAMQVQISQEIDQRHKIGIFWDYASTGSRIHYSDYSGEVKIDQIAYRHAGGLLFEENVKTKGRLTLLSLCRLACIYSCFRVDEANQIYGQKSEKASRFTSLGLAISPEVTTQFRILTFTLRTGIGYEFTVLKPALHAPGNSDFKLRSSRGEVRLNWEGLRLGIALLIQL